MFCLAIKQSLQKLVLANLPSYFYFLMIFHDSPGNLLSMSANRTPFIKYSGSKEVTILNLLLPKYLMPLE